MIFPISHERMEARRWPVVTIALIVINVLVHVVTSLGGEAREDHLTEAVQQALVYRAAHPDVDPCPALRPFATHRPTESPEDFTAGDETPAEAREEFDVLCKDVQASLDAIPRYRFGDSPGSGKILTLVSYAFFHAGWLHLIGNMWFLFLAGLALEDRWGRLPFLGFYLAAAVVAALSNRWFAVSGGYVVGASGAVAGVMGAFLLLFAKVRVRFVYFLFTKPALFWAPAYVMLPLWLAVEAIEALIGIPGDTTAHGVHLGGFVFGALAAGLLRWAGADRKLDDAVERAAVLGDDPRIDAARVLVQRKQTQEAMNMMEGLAKEKPESVHVWEALREVALARGDNAAAERAAARVAELRRAREAREKKENPYDAPAG